MERHEHLSRVFDSDQTWDLLVIGGGATGVGVAVHDLAFIVPNYDWWEAPFYGIGMKVYDMLAGKYGFGKSKLLSKSDVRQRIPQLEEDGLRCRAGIDFPALFLMDEVAQLGYMDVLESAMQIARGYNVKFWFFIQSVSYLQQYYPKSWKMFFETSQMISSFGLTDVDTAEIFSKMVGSTTVVKPSFSQSSGSNESTSYTKGSHSSSGPGGGSSGSSSSTTDTYGVNSSTSRNYDLVGRRVVMAEELLRLDPNDQLVFFRGLPALMCQKLHYSASKQLREMVDQGVPALPHLIDPEGLHADPEIDAEAARK